MAHPVGGDTGEGVEQRGLTRTGWAHQPAHLVRVTVRARARARARARVTARVRVRARDGVVV